ncbi:MAG: M28 family peptidase [Flavobacteriia bacterium]|nr:M28 family peptidase [Flavobacteriia bacterium]
MRAYWILIYGVLLVSCKQSEPTLVTLEDDVIQLSADAFEGRETGKAGEKKAADYITERFKNLKLLPKGTNGFLQEFSFKNSSSPHEKPKFSEEKSDSLTIGRNVIAYLDNQAETTIVIGAHFDHLGYGIQGSLFPGVDTIHNGADDNASGVAMMLKLAYELQNENQQKVKNNNYLFIAFSGEEMGLLGSNYFVKNPTIDLNKVNYMINMDMVGRLNEEKAISISGVGTSPSFSQTLQAVNEFGLKIIENQSGVGPSDHTSFYLSDIPVLHFFTGQHEDYHKPSDDAHLINYVGMETLSNYILAVVKDLDGFGKLAFRTTKNESEETPRFKVGLGVVPDYLFDGKGMRIDGISEGKPAQKAGLQKGDIIKKLDTITITDMMSYMKALSTFEAGQKTKVTLDRKGEILEMEVTF